MSKSIERVRAQAEASGLAIEIVRMAGSTRTAQEAAAECGCSVAQIVKSLIFQGKDSGQLYLFLLSGDRQLDPLKAANVAHETLQRADPRLVRQETGFAIGGVAPIGHRTRPHTYADESLLMHELVWAAAGAPDAVFSARPADLIKAAGAQLCDIASRR